MDRHRGGDRHSNNTDSHHSFRHSRIGGGGGPHSMNDRYGSHGVDGGGGHVVDRYHHPRGGGGGRSPNNYRAGNVGRDRRAFDSPPRYASPAGGGGYRPVDGGASAVDGAGGGYGPMSGGGVEYRTVGGAGEFYSDHQMPPLTGQKRAYPFSGRGGSPERIDGSSFAKLFVGSVPRTASEDDIRPLFEQHGRVIEVALIRDKRTGQQQVSGFLVFVATSRYVRPVNQAGERINPLEQNLCIAVEN